MAGYEIDPCEKCEEVMQPYLDRVLSEAEVTRPRSTSRLSLLREALPVRGESPRVRAQVL